MVSSLTIMCRNDELSWTISCVGCLLPDSVLPDKRMLRGWENPPEILKRIWLFSVNKIKSSESVSKQPTQLIVELDSSVRHIIVTKIDVSHQQSYVCT